MGVGFGLYMYDIVVKRSRSLSHLLTSSCYRQLRVVHSIAVYFIRQLTVVHIMPFVSCTVQMYLIAVKCDSFWS